MRGFIAASVASILIGWLSPLAATTYLVLPDGTGDFPTIQSALDAAVNGDVIELGDGTFRGEGNRAFVLSKALILRSVSGDPDRCVIDCEGSSSESSGIGIWPSATSSAVMQGLSVIHGYGESHGGVLCRASISFVDCVFADNTVEWGYGGGGVCCRDCGPTFIGCHFERNSSLDAGGGGVLVYFGGPVLFDGCTFLQNVAPVGGGGCGLYESSAMLSDCVFLENVAPVGGAVTAGQGASATMERCTVVGNFGGGLCACNGSLLTATTTVIAWNGDGVGFCCSGTGVGALSCCDIFGNEGGDWVGCIEGQQGMNGNISLDPLFCDWQGGDFHLQIGSPCAPDYNPVCGLIGALPVGCGSTPAQETTWGAMKALFRGDAK